MDSLVKLQRCDLIKYFWTLLAGVGFREIVHVDLEEISILLVVQIQLFQFVIFHDKLVDHEVFLCDSL